MDFLDPIGPDNRAYVPCFKKGKNDSEVDSEILRLPPQFQRVGTSPWFQQARQPPATAWRQSCPAELGSRMAARAGLEGGTQSQRGLSSPEDLMELALLGFGLAWDPSPLPSFLFLLFGVRMSILCCPTIEFWKHITYLVSQVHSWT